jgi:hypothetical protein
MEILSHGSSWEVIQPKWFRQDVASGFRMGYRLYYVDGRENKSEECKKMRDLLLSWTPVISKYANGDTVIFVENINNPREPQMSLQVKDQYSVIVGYNDMDKLYLGVKYENDTNAKEVKHSLDTMRINIMLPLRTDGWYGWQKMTNDNGLNLIISILERLGLHSK